MKSSKLLAAFFASAIPLTASRADDGGSAPLHLENTVMVAHDDTINMYNVPTSGPNGKVYNIEIHLAVGADGAVTLTSSKATPAVVLPISLDQFVPGEYHCISGNEGTIDVTGPINSPGGRHIWSFLAHNTSSLPSWSCAGTWTTGPAAGHPQIADIDPSVAFATGYTIGRSRDGSLLLVQQMGDKLILGEPDQIQSPTTNGREYILRTYLIFQRKPDVAN